MKTYTISWTKDSQVERSQNSGPSIGYMLGQRLRRWRNIDPMLGEFIKKTAVFSLVVIQFVAETVIMVTAGVYKQLSKRIFFIGS